MAVEAQHMNYFPPQLLAERDLIKSNQAIYNNTQMDYSNPLPALMPDQQILPFYQQSDSGLTYLGSRKRIRDSDLEAYNQTSQKHRLSGNGDVFFQFQQQQADINSLIAEHTEKIKVELEERRKSQLRNLLTTVQEKVSLKMKEKDDEIQRIGKLNWVLQERVKSLYVENQIWRDLAQTNEATANSLRSNLEQVLAHVSSDGDNHNHNHRHVSAGGGGGGGGLVDTADDAESSCGSSDHGIGKEEEVLQIGKWQSRRPAVVGGGRSCRKCGEKESSVLLLPCRHMCLCTSCGSTLFANCPVCDSVTNASLRVNMS